MMRRTLIGFVALALLAAEASACCGVQRPELRIELADQEILVSWNAKTKRETFVRRASFRPGAAPDFGFLVPTPTQPALAEAPEEVFERLRPLLRPKVVYEKVYRPSFTPMVLWPFAVLWLGDIPKSAAPRSGVRVLAEQRVAGYDAAVLEADSTAALVEWLAKHTYAITPAVREWVEPYVARKWKITAFRYARGRTADPGVTTGAISMTFETDRPLFPFRVPTSQIARPGAASMLRVYYVGDARVEGTLGDQARPWGAALKVAMPFADLTALLEGAVPAAELPERPWLTAFEDRPWPSGTEDLYFRPAKDPAPFQQVVQETDTVYVPVPPDALLLALGFLAFRWRRARKGATGRS